MHQQDQPDKSEIHIVCTTDFTPDSERSFYHALALALAKRARLTLLHVGTESREQVPWQRFPSVRETLQRWRLIQSPQPREAVTEMIEVRKKAMRDEEPVQGILDFIDVHRVDLLVMIAHQIQGWGPLRKTPTALRVLRAAASDLLLLPDDGPDVLDRESGQFHLRHILLPVCGNRDIRGAISSIGALLHKVAGDGLSVTLLETGNGKRRTDHPLPANPGIDWQVVQRPGKPLEIILEEADRIDADLIVMPATRGTRLFDRWNGTRPEQVLSRVRRPLLAVTSG